VGLKGLSSIALEEDLIEDDGSACKLVVLPWC
jgi:hypothetical protein